MDTTLNIRTDILEQIEKAANLKHISCSGVIAFLIKKVADDITNFGRIGQIVQYQCRHHLEKYRITHVQFREDVYEYCQDLRKLLKMSASLILAYAVGRYLGFPEKVRCPSILLIAPT